MIIQLNGKSQELTDHIETVADLLAFFELQNRIVIVEINKDIIQKEQYSIQDLKDGDAVELIHFVGGG
ncbi:sulfur carrier protein ThiS [Niallia nealsonii]|uniref:Thiamine biosynthesis protein ThiS n=1 Tax=Niallia nealsonii TaxID=115979 RepID=A0A2N0Z6E6_9BACI|nr:sulfur carrier protein ThiS [Niallia nealsonii]PKG25085.1 thiamine biosynthesis protein ThiS [Niallia nealsonii]